MNCQEFRQTVGADPGSSAPELTAHARDCAACARHWQELRSMDDVIRRALQIEFEDKAQVIPLTRSHRKRWSMPLSIAASVTMAAALGLILWLSLPGEALARQLVAHVEHEPQSLVRTAHTVDPGELNAILARSGLTLKPGIGSISYAMSCPFRGHQVPHLVMQTETGPVTVLVLPEETSVKHRQAFDEGGFSGVIVPAPRGALAVLGRDVPVDQVAERFLAAVQYTR